MSAEHGRQCDGERDSTPVGTHPVRPTASKCRGSVARKVGDGWACAIVADVLRASDLSDAGVARTLEVSESRAEALRTGRAPWHLGDLARMPRSVAIAIAKRVLVALESPTRPGVSIEAHALRVGAKVGDLQNEALEAIADGEIDEKERAALTRKVRAARDELDSFDRDLAATVTTKGG